jgi:hypothetical protein
MGYPLAILGTAVLLVVRLAAGNSDIWNHNKSVTSILSMILAVSAYLAIVDPCLGRGRGNSGPGNECQA